MAVPEDIVYAILDHLQNDIPILSECSVVCRAWLHPSRRHLFRKVIIRFTSTSVQERGGLLAFANLLRACADARQYLQHLILDALLFSFTDVDVDVDAVLSPLEIFTILDIGTNIEILTLLNFVWMLNANWVPPLPRYTLTKLDIDQWIVSDQCVLDVFKLISVFDRVNVLALSLSMEQSFHHDEDIKGLIEEHAKTGHFPTVHTFLYYTSSEWSATPLYRSIERSCRRDQGVLAHISFRIWDYTSSWGCITEFCEFVCNSDVRFHLRELAFHPGSDETLWSAIPRECLTQQSAGCTIRSARAHVCMSIHQFPIGMCSTSHDWKRWSN